VRWDLLDKFEILKKGSRSRALKAFTGKEDFFEEHFPGAPSVPETLFVEMIAQTGGVLFGLGIDFKKEVILAKIAKAEFFLEVPPPCDFVIEAALDEAREEGAWITGTVKTKKGELAAKATLLLACVDSLDSKKQIVFNDGFLKHFDVYEVARQSEERA
jgi:3-hydroxyacyl-[acyl-carrier-protein] dehydratase